MSTKLDQSLDEIMTNTGAVRGGRNGRARRARPARKTNTPAAPVGGVAKSTRAAKSAVKTAPTGPALSRDSKIVVSNLPKDIVESQIKEYFAKTAGPVKRVELSYGPTGVSRGVANILFAKADGATKAATALNGILIDGKPMKIEIIVDASQAPVITAPKGLGDRISQPKPHPKSAAATKANTNNARGAEAGKGKRGGRGGRAAKNGRPAKKTAEELDSEMVDYFVAAAPADAAPTAAPVAATGGDAPMEDEIL